MAQRTIVLSLILASYLSRIGFRLLGLLFLTSLCSNFIFFRIELNKKVITPSEKDSDLNHSAILSCLNLGHVDPSAQFFCDLIDCSYIFATIKCIIARHLILRSQVEAQHLHYLH